MASVIPRTVPITHTVILVTSTNSTLIVRAFALGLGQIPEITATTILALQVTTIAVDAISTGSMLVVRAAALGLDHQTITAITILAQI